MSPELSELQFCHAPEKNGQNFDFRGSPLWYSINTTDLVHVENNVVGRVRPVLISQVLQHRLLARIHLVLLLGAILEKKIKENFELVLPQHKN